MEVLIDSLIEGAERAKGTVVIIDVFRAFTTEAIAFSRGAEKIILTRDPDAALELRKQGVVDLCMGEVNGIRPRGFDFGNSPFALSTADVKGKVISHSTMAGTVGVNSARNADQVYVGSLVLAESTAKAILSDRPDVVTIVAMGDGGLDRADEDEQCALYLRNLLEGRRPDRSAVKDLVLAGGQAPKYDDPEQPHFHPEDRAMALDIDSCPFAVRVAEVEGMLVARPVVV